MIEDTPEDGNTPGVVPDWVDNGGSGPLGYRKAEDAKGDTVDIVMQREVVKQANLRARLCDLGVPVDLRERCFVHGDVDSRFDEITMPWAVIYALIESERSAHRMGVMS